MVRQVEQGRVVEIWVRLLVNVQVPVLVVNRGGHLRVQAREEGRVGQVKLRHAEVIADKIADSVLCVSDEKRGLKLRQNVFINNFKVCQSLNW